MSSALRTYDDESAFQWRNSGKATGVKMFCLLGAIYSRQNDRYASCKLVSKVFTMDLDVGSDVIAVLIDLIMKFIK